MTEAESKLEAARMAIILASNQPNNENGPTMIFFTHLLQRMEHIAAEQFQGQKVEGICTDGHRVIYSESYVLEASTKEIVGQYAHIALHISYEHNLRRGFRDFNKWQIATDLAVNDDLLEAGVYLPDDAIWPGKKGTPFAKLKRAESADDYYDQLPDSPQGQGGSGKGGGSGWAPPGGGGTCFDGESERVAEQQMAVDAAHAAGRQAGKLKGNIDRNIASTREATVDWKEVLRRFILVRSRDDYSWQRPNRRHIHMGLYLPSMDSLRIGHIVISVDCSGSISERELEQFAAETQDIVSCGASKVTILYHNVDVEKTQEWVSTDGPLTLSPCPSGGTSHLDVFKKIGEMEESPVCVVCLTDMYSDFPKQAPSYPVLFAQIGNDKAIKEPFGELVRVKL